MQYFVFSAIDLSIQIAPVVLAIKNRKYVLLSLNLVWGYGLEVIGKP